MDELVSYDGIYFYVSIVITVIPFYWLRKAEKQKKYYYLPLIFFVWVYCGVGMGWDGTPADYLIYYGLYMTVVGITCYKTQSKYVRSEAEVLQHKKFFDNFIFKYSKKTILLYILICIGSIAAKGKFLNILIPPSLSLTEALDFSKTGVSGGAIYMLLYYIRYIVFPFYLLALYVYRDNIKKLSFFLLFPLYIDFAGSGYIARSGVMPYIIILYIAFYLKYPQYQRKILITTLLGIPIALVGLSWFTFMRIGKEIDINAGDAIKLLTFEETGYPILFSEIQRLGFDEKLMCDYIKWLIGLPFPGFLKGGEDFSFNILFTEMVTGMSRDQMGFSVILPGLVGEGVCIWGKLGFMFHAFMVGYIYTKAYDLFWHKEELFLLLYCSIYGGLCFARGGTTSMMPFYLKMLIMYVIFIHFTLKKNRKL